MAYFSPMVSKHMASPRLRRLRRDRNLSLDVVSLKTGIDRAALSRKERQLAPVSEAELIQLAAFFGVSPSKLRGEKVPPGPNRVRRRGKATP
jgi:transcriptional regulator with XRE-family HTH domain